jgi:hypothetical protein
VCVCVCVCNEEGIDVMVECFVKPFRVRGDRVYLREVRSSCHDFG